jgi:hypothetical protein
MKQLRTTESAYVKSGEGKRFPSVKHRFMTDARSPVCPDKN